MNPVAAREMFNLLYGHPRETCPHCHKPRHSVKCRPQLEYERRMDGDQEPEAAK
jgi:hypothetical protein